MNLFGVFVKHPQPGKVKTRLAADIGPENAAAVYSAFVNDLVARFRQTADRRLLGYSPKTDDATKFFSELVGVDYQLWPQPDVGLGERMAGFFQHAFGVGAKRVVLIGSDSPSLPLRYVEQAFELLSNNDMVFGPATDGGYYLVGLNRSCSEQAQELFSEIDWSSERVLAQSINRAQRCDVSVGLLDPWYDVDTLDDLRMLVGHLRALAASNTTPTAEKTTDLPATCEVLQRLKAVLD